MRMCISQKFNHLYVLLLVLNIGIIDLAVQLFLIIAKDITNLVKFLACIM